MIKASINVTKIEKGEIYVGKIGKYVGLVFFENKNGPDQFGNDGFVTQGPADRYQGRTHNDTGEEIPF
jgi:hypothetical protein